MAVSEWQRALLLLCALPELARAQTVCVAGSGSPAELGYVVDSPDATTAPGLGKVGCARTHHGVATVTCDVAGGSFAYSGCVRHQCAVPGYVQPDSRCADEYICEVGLVSEYGCGEITASNKIAVLPDFRGSIGEFLCPLTCGKCPASSYPEYHDTTGYTVAHCIDDWDGVLASVGTNCADVLSQASMDHWASTDGVGCDADVSHLDTSLSGAFDLATIGATVADAVLTDTIWAELQEAWVPGQTIGQHCPVSCGICQRDPSGLSLSHLECSANYDGNATATCSRAAPAVTSTCDSLLTLPHVVAPDVVVIGMDAGYPDNYECSWEISCARGHAEMQVVMVDTEEGTDQVEVFDVADNFRSKVAEFSGHAVPARQISNTSAFEVVFESDGDITGSGFIAHMSCSPTYKFSGCVETRCQPLAVVPEGYSFDNAGAETVSALGVVKCATGYGGNAQAHCQTPGGAFNFTGCTMQECAAGSGDRVGYEVCQNDVKMQENMAAYGAVQSTCETLMTDSCGMCHRECGTTCECSSQADCGGQQFCSSIPVGIARQHSGAEFFSTVIAAATDLVSSWGVDAVFTLAPEDKWNECGECLTCSPGCECIHSICDRYNMSEGDICARSSTCQICKNECAATQICEDDHNHLLASWGQSCRVFSEHFGISCDQDLHIYAPESVPTGQLMSVVCPVTCRACSSAVEIADASCLADCEASAACTSSASVLSRCAFLDRKGQALVCARTTAEDVQNPAITEPGVSDIACPAQSASNTPAAQCHEACESSDVCTQAAQEGTEFHGTRLGAMAASSGCSWAITDVLSEYADSSDKLLLSDVCPQVCGLCDSNATKIDMLSGYIYCAEHYTGQESRSTGSVTCPSTDLTIRGTCKQQPVLARKLSTTEAEKISAIHHPSFGLFPGYGQLQHCEWSLECRLGNVEVSFQEFNLESCNDFLTVYDGPTTTAPVLRRLTGTGNQDRVVSSGNSLYVVFSADDYVQGTGFLANVKCIGHPSLVSQQEGAFEASSTTNPCLNVATEASTYSPEPSYAWMPRCCDTSKSCTDDTTSTTACQHYCCASDYLCTVSSNSGTWDGNDRVECPSEAISCPAAEAQSCEKKYAIQAAVAEQFVFSGCTPVQCVPGSGDRRGYNIANPSALDVPSMGTITCRSDYHTLTKAQQSCARNGRDFSFTGCMENQCTHRSEDTRGATVPAGSDSTTTVSAMREVAIAGGWDDCGCPSGMGWEIDNLGVGSCTTTVTQTSEADLAECVSTSVLTGDYPLYLECGWRYSGVATVTCPSDGGQFEYKGCTEEITLWILVLPPLLLVLCVIPCVCMWAKRKLHGTQTVWIDDIARMDNAEMQAAVHAADNDIAKSEMLVFHFTSADSANLIIKPRSYGLRASSVGQLGGGLSVCLTPPHELGWDKYGKGEFRANVGKALWGEKWQHVLEGGPDADKLDICFFLRVPKEFMKNTERIVPGRPSVYIIQKSLLTERPDGNHYLPVSRIVKAYSLKDNRAACQPDMEPEPEHDGSTAVDIDLELQMEQQETIVEGVPDVRTQVRQGNIPTTVPTESSGSGDRDSTVEVSAGAIVCA